MTDRLYTIVLELDRRLESPGSFSLGGGLGLFLKQEHLRRARDVRTLYPIDELPAARTTNDADIFLRADVVADVGRMRRIRDILDDLEFEPIESAKFMQFAKTVPEGINQAHTLPENDDSSPPLRATPRSAARQRSVSQAETRLTGRRSTTSSSPSAAAMRRGVARLGVTSPASSRATAGCVLPIREASSACVIPRRSRARRTRSASSKAALARR